MRVLVTGASGVLGRYLLASRPATATVLGWSAQVHPPSDDLPLTPVDLTHTRALDAAYRMSRPASVIHLAALASVADCARDPARARALNTDATARLAALAQVDGIPFLFASTDLVFDGISPPYREDAPPNPLSIYGQSKRDAERHVLDAGGTVVRLSLLYGPGRNDRTTFFDTMVTALRSDRPVSLFADEYRTPLDLPSAAAILWALAFLPGQGILHVGGPERLSRLDMGLRLATFLGIAAPVIHATGRTSAGAELRPGDTSLDSSRLTTLLPDLPRPTYEQVLARLFA
jgi:dTDP-4-dehydrorhamnose reductase